MAFYDIYIYIWVLAKNCPSPPVRGGRNHQIGQHDSKQKIEYFIQVYNLLEPQNLHQKETFPFLLRESFLLLVQ